MSKMLIASEYYIAASVFAMSYLLDCLYTNLVLIFHCSVGNFIYNCWELHGVLGQRLY